MTPRAPRAQEAPATAAVLTRTSPPLPRGRDRALEVVDRQAAPHAVRPFFRKAGPPDRTTEAGRTRIAQDATPDGAFTYESNETDSTVSVIGTATATVLDTVRGSATSGTCHRAPPSAAQAR